jgi:hypothetical protein
LWACEEHAQHANKRSPPREVCVDIPESSRDVLR